MTWDGGSHYDNVETCSNCGESHNPGGDCKCDRDAELAQKREETINSVLSNKWWEIWK